MGHGSAGGGAGQDANVQGRDGGQGVVEDGDEGRAVVRVVCWVRSGFCDADDARDALGEVVAHAVELDDDVLLDDVGGDVRCFEAHGVDEELLLCGDEGVVEETWLGPDVCEGG